MNTYRVDRNDSAKTTPVGMNSLLYCGDSLQRARRIFDEAVPHRDVWNVPNKRYGITLARWDETKRDYTIIKTKGLS